MPYLKCVPCKTRLHTTMMQADPAGELCPECGLLLEPVGELAEIVGFQAIRPRDDRPADVTGGQRGVVDHVDAFLARREAILGQARPDDDEGWADDGEALPEAMAVALPRPDIPRPDLPR